MTRPKYRIAAATVCALALACARSDTDDDASDRLETMSFERVQLLEETSETSANVSIGDVNDDGHLDVVLVKGRHWPLVDFVLLGDGTGAFDEPAPLGGAADRSYTGALVDIDADGDLDVIVSNDDPDPKLIYLNDGTGAFALASTFGRPEWSTRHVSVAELDGDGHPDIVVANRSGNRPGQSYVCFNKGGARFGDECYGFATESATTITPADFDGDGRLDLVVPHRDGGQSHLYLNDTEASFAERVPFGPEDANIRAAKVGDVNEDGRPDLVVIDQMKGPAILLGEADLRFGAPRPLGSSGATPYALALADLNQDDHVDVIVGYVESRPVAYFGDGSGAFTEVAFGDDQGVAYGFATGDIDEDGFIDIAVARSDAPNVLYFGGPPPDAPQG